MNSIASAFKDKDDVLTVVEELALRAPSLDERKAKIWITPDLAAKMLTRNAGNRPLRRKHVEKLAETMKSGMWLLNPNGILFGKTGRLLDGQHRLHAVILAGIPVEMNVTIKVDDAVFGVLDRNAVRSVADVMQVDKKYLEVVKLIIAYVTVSSSPADFRVKLLYEELEREIVDLHSFCPTTTRAYSTASFRTAAVLHIMGKTNGEYAKNAYRNMVLGDIAKLDPAQASLFSAIARGSVTTANRDDLLARAWRAFDKKRAHVEKVQIKNFDLVRQEIVKVVMERVPAAIAKEVFK